MPSARDLFKGDEPQRAGKFFEALDKFQRAEQVIHALTNVLRIECQGHDGASGRGGGVVPAGHALAHAGLGAGKTPGSIESGASGAASNTTSFGAVVGVIANPDRVSFFGEVGLQGRWYSLTWTDSSGGQSANYSGAELLLGMGLWLPVGHTFRLLPELTGGLGSFNPPSNASGATNSAGHGFIMLGVGGLFNIDL